MPSREPVTLSDPKSIRALAHPARLAVIEELYTGRELTATECAEIAGLSPSAMSYHLRSLEKAGIVERADTARDGRERPWRAAGAYLKVESTSYAAEAAALSATVLSRLNDQFAEWLARRSSEDPEWRQASSVSSGQVWLTVDELEALGDNITELIEQFRPRAEGDRPDGARRVRFALFAFPTASPATPTPRVEP